MSHQAPSSSRAGKGFLVLIGLSLILVGSTFIWLMARSYLRAKEMRSWPQAECVILRSEIIKRRHDPYSPLEYQHQLSFGYTWNEQALTSDRISLRGSKWSSNLQKAENSQQTYPLGSTCPCFIHPQTPELAVLELDSLAPGYSIWFPCLFVVGGIGIVVRALR